ncbi:MAG TPA: TIGR04282 family arsenosugar biosynthesis glycosyltransferase [Sporichthya sp.]|nr:TIGR04282 family arsenosugar biosynthesis glycosyltransferase [Sporichthya sp.]
MTPLLTTILVMAKTPVPGRVKTRLCPPFTPTQAAELAEAALLDTLDTVLAAPAERRILALAGAPGSWVPAGFEVVAQRGAGLDERIAHALAPLSGPVLVIGMDTPQLTVGQLTLSWEEHDAWFGPAADGGFWALALRKPDPDLVVGVPMSRSDTGAVQLARLRAARLTVGLLPELRDVDTPEDAAAVAAATPASRFATRHATSIAALPADVQDRVVTHVG